MGGCACVSSSRENNKLGLYYNIYIHRPNPRVLTRALLYRYKVTVCTCVCVCASRNRIAGGRDLRCRFYGYRANGLGIYVHLLFVASRYSGRPDLAVNNIPAEGTGAKGTEEVWWCGLRLHGAETNGSEGETARTPLCMCVYII